MQHVPDSTPLLSWKKIYNAGMVFGVLGIVSESIFSQRWLSNNFMLCAGVLFGIGFCSWLFSLIRKHWHSFLGKIYISFFHGAIFFITIVPARLLVSEALGLPAQDFDATVELVGIIIYPALWLCVASLTIFVCALTMVMLATIVSLSCMPLLDGLTMVVAKLLPDSSIKDFLQTGRRDFVSRMMKHWAGAAVVSLVISYAAGAQFTALMTHNQPIKWLAYVADYQHADLYPGIRQGARYRLLDNGLVSYATNKNWEIQISIEKLEQ